MDEISRIAELALEAGFSVAAPLNRSAVKLRPEVRAMCAADQCHAYGKNWTCPPGCGTLEECTERAGRYHSGIIVQTVGNLEDEFDIEGMTELAEKHASLFAAFSKSLHKIHPSMLPLGAGGCRLCKECTYPNDPCRFPDIAMSSMEAYGLLVSDVCTASGIPYYHGPGTLAYVGCFLFNTEE